MNKTRITAIDIGKCLSMLLIIFSHVLQRTTPNYVDNWYSSFILLLALPPFFLFSGISHSFRKPVNLKGFLYYLIKDALMYMVPFLWFIAMRIWFYGQWNGSWNDAWNELMQYPVSSLWVCWILVFISMILDIGLFVSYLKPNLKKVFVSTLLVVGLITIIILRKCFVIDIDSRIGYDYFVAYTPLFIIGYCIGDLFTRFNKNLYLYISLGVGIVGIFLVTFFGPNLIKVNFYQHIWMFFLAEFFSVLFWFGITNLLDKTKLQKPLSFLGRYTMEAYFLHLMVVKAWSSMTSIYNSPLAIIFVTIGIFLILLINIVATIVILYHIPFAHFILFGRHYSRYKFENDFFDKIKGKLSEIDR